MKAGFAMKNDVILNKVSIIERCIKRIHEEYQNNPQYIRNNTKQDSIILNLLRGCEASIALAMHIVAEKKLDVPQKSQDAFTLLEVEGIIPLLFPKKCRLWLGLDMTLFIIIMKLT